MGLKFTNIQHDFRKLHGLTNNEYVFCDMVFFLCKSSGSKVPGWCYMSKENMGGELGISKQSVITLAKKMVDDGFIIKQEVTGFYQTTAKWETVYFTDGKESLPVENIVDESSKESLPDDGKESLPHNSNLNNNNIKSNKDANLFSTTQPPFNFKKSLLSLNADAKLVDQWMAVRKLKKLSPTEAAFDEFRKEVEKIDNADINDVLRLCSVKSWGGFKKSWYDKHLTENENGGNTTTGNGNGNSNRVAYKFDFDRASEAAGVGGNQ